MKHERECSTNLFLLQEGDESSLAKELLLLRELEPQRERGINWMLNWYGMGGIEENIPREKTLWRGIGNWRGFVQRSTCGVG